MPNAKMESCPLLLPLSLLLAVLWVFLTHGAPCPPVYWADFNVFCIQHSLFSVTFIARETGNSYFWVLSI